MEVQDPFQTSSKIASGYVRFLVAVDVYPFNAFAQFKGPGLAAVFTAPLFRNSRRQCTFWISFQQTVYQLSQVLTVLSSLAVEPVESFQLTGQCVWNNQVSDFIFTRFVAFSSFPLGGFRAFCCPSVVAGVRRFLCCGSAAAACQNKRRCQSQSKQSGDCLFHIISSLDHRSLSV